MSKIIAIDYGRRHIGLAISEEELGVATILPSLTVSAGKDPVTVLENFLKGHSDAQLIIIGLPSGLGGKPTQMSQEVSTFAKLLQERVSIPQLFWDETLTSKQAERGRKKSQNSHSHAARIILQEYLDSQTYG